MLFWSVDNRENEVADEGFGLVGLYKNGTEYQSTDRDYGL